MSKSKNNLEDEVNKLRSILAKMPGHIYWQDINGVYQGCNEQQAKSAGLKSVDEIIGKTNADLPWNKNSNIPEILDKANCEVINTKKAITIEEPGKLVDGTTAVFLSKKEPLFDKNGNVIGILGTSLDITELKKAQQDYAEQIKKTAAAYKAKSEFLSIVTHEMRGPIANVTTLLMALVSEINKIKEFFHTEVLDNFNNNEKGILVSKFNDINNQIINHCNICSKESTKALNYLENLGELHKLQTEGIKSRFEETNIANLIERAINNNSYLNTDTIDISVNISKNIPENVVIDYRNIYEALQIIIGNAIRFSKKDGVVLIKAEANNNDKQKYIKITIEDFGIGISENTLNNIFTALTNNVNTDDTHKYNKPSLRLPQAKLKIEASDGKLSIESSPEKGTKVVLIIPYKDALGITKAKELLSDKIHSKILNILLIEDDPIAQLNHKKLLEDHGHHIDIATTGYQGIQLYESKNYDLLLLDITLPDINGIEVLRKLKHKFNKYIPVIVITSHASEDDIDLFLNEGAITVLPKPVKEEQLKDSIDAFLDSDKND